MNRTVTFAGFAICILVCISILGCGSQEGARSPLPSRVGPQGEVLVVCSDAIWKGEIGDTLRSILLKPFSVLPQMHTETYEPMFDLVHKTRHDFNKFWKPHRNIIDIEIADRIDTQKPTVIFYTERYSQGQIYMVAKGKTHKGIAEKFAERAEEMVSLLHDVEVKRSAAITKLSVNEVIERQVREVWGVDVSWPKGTYAVRVDTTFTWIDRQLTRFKGSDNHDVQQGFFIHSEPYIGPTQFSLDHLLDRRDKLTKRYVSGPTEGSYMAVERRMIPRYEEISFKGKFAAEVRGLWRMENDFMGGPFYSLTMYDEENARLLTVEAYVYAPYFDKRVYMREVEGIVKSTEKAVVVDADLAVDAASK